MKWTIFWLLSLYIIFISFYQVINQFSSFSNNTVNYMFIQQWITLLHSCRQVCWHFLRNQKFHNFSFVSSAYLYLLMLIPFIYHSWSYDNLCRHMTFESTGQNVICLVIYLSSYLIRGILKHVLYNCKVSQQLCINTTEKLGKY